MRIAYISSYQGPELLRRRPIVRNRSLANTIKLELIARLLHSASHQVEVLSQGEVVEPGFGIFRGFRETEPFSQEIPVYYASATPIPKVRVVWSSLQLLRLFKARHRAAPFDVAIVWNLQQPRMACANYALRRLRIPVVLQYEDDAFVDIWGNPTRNAFGYHTYARQVLRDVSGCIACSPYLLSQASERVPKLLLRGVIGEDLLQASSGAAGAKANRVVFSGTHCRQYGIDSLITAWQEVGLKEWELHITGQGPETDNLKRLANGVPGVRFHGLVPRSKLVELMASARICINPHDVSQIQGNLFSFKIVEYLASGAHVITTPMGEVEKELEQGITYIENNEPNQIGAALKSVVRTRKWERASPEAVWKRYGAEAVAASLNAMLRQVCGRVALEDSNAKSLPTSSKSLREKLLAN